MKEVNRKEFSIKWTNGSESHQTWEIEKVDSGFKLDQGASRSAVIGIQKNHTYTLRVTIEAFIDHKHVTLICTAELTYSANHNKWTLESDHPQHWELHQKDQFLSVECRLDETEKKDPSYRVVDLDVKWPAYQLFNDLNRDVYCSENLIRNDADAEQWIKDCCKHFGVRCKNRWRSDEQSGTIWAN